MQRTWSSRSGIFAGAAEVFLAALLIACAPMIAREPSPAPAAQPLPDPAGEASDPAPTEISAPVPLAESEAAAGVEPGPQRAPPVELSEEEARMLPLGGPIHESLGPYGTASSTLSRWDDVLRTLPKDFAGGIDWVAAVRRGVVHPRLHPDPSRRLEPPFTLDTLVPGIARDGQPPLDLDIPLVPADAPFFQVRFPHSGHTLWLNCSSCHPGILGQRVGMEKIFSGEYCGTCHGRVSFALETGCARCHTNLQPPEPEAVEADLAWARENPSEPTPATLRWGKTFYDGLCAVCHGVEGDGNGPFARFLETKPRDFTSGTFKFRTTPSGSNPTDLDIFRTITTGVTGTAMPAWSKVPRNDRWAIVHYLKTFTDVFEYEPEPPIEIDAPPPLTDALIARGAEVFQEAKCWDCHGHSGRGDGPSAAQLKDDWGVPIRPADFTKGHLKSGPDVTDVFRTVATGLDGSPMPSYFDALEREDLWALAQYIHSLGREQRGFGIKGDVTLYFRPPRGGDEEQYPAEEVLPASFPHWFHRIRFRCATCHPAIFEMRKEANPITMDAIRQGQYCAQCHNGRTAWQVGFDTCRRCHSAGSPVEPTSSDGALPDRTGRVASHVEAYRD